MPKTALVTPPRMEGLSFIAPASPSSLTSTQDGLASLGRSHRPPSTLPPASSTGLPPGHLPVPTLGFSEPHTRPRPLAPKLASPTPASPLCSSQQVSPLLRVLQLHSCPASLSRMENPASTPLRKLRSLQWPAVVVCPHGFSLSC